MKKLINYHVPDPTNVGDLLSSPLKYFDFSSFDYEAKDIREVNSSNTVDAHAIIGGGGLLYSRFLPQIKNVLNGHQGKKILWGVGQQRYVTGDKEHQLFDYSPYFQGCDLIGIRDVGMNYPWVPCVSCMHPTFDRPRTAKHKFVILSHKKFQISFPGIPRMTNENPNFEEVIDFLGSGETILTSSFHAAYWGTLLNRKVIVFPFNSKFFTMKHPPTIYPTGDWNRIRWKLSLFGKTLYQVKHPEHVLTCETRGWREYVNQTKTYPESLEECREGNRWFYQQTLKILDS